MKFAFGTILMPHKLRNSRRHKFKKSRYKITNWRDYNKALIERGSITLWLSPKIIKSWRAKKSKQKLQCAQFKYSDLAIETAITIKAAMHMPYRATQGFFESLFKLMNLSLTTPNYTTMCRRMVKLELPKLSNVCDDKDIHVVVDSTGLKIFGAGQWHEEKHGLKKLRHWRKFHIAVDRNSHAIIAQELTTNCVTDDATVATMLESIDQNITHFSADKAYDRSNVYRAVIDNSDPDVTIAIPPTANAVLHEDNPEQFGSRNHNLNYINAHGSYRWQDASDYNYRALVETAMHRYKTIIGERLYSRRMSAQKMESRIACVILNKMTALGMPKPLKIKVAA
jgi:hypothetical protein